MNLSLTWRDFVLFSFDPDRVQTREARFDLTAVGAQVVGQEIVVWPGDAFDAMRVDELGNVSIWTKKRAWFLRREHGIEKLLSIPRDPHEDPDLG